MVEIGSWQGKSSVILAKAAGNRRNGIVYCIDPFDASGDALSVPAFQERLKGASGDLKGVFLANIARCKVAGRIRVRQGTSSEVAVSWTEKIDLLFIDGDHSYDGVRRDFLAWTKFLRPGGLLLLHDVCPDHTENPKHPDGPYRIVQEYIRDDPQWRSQRLICSLFIAQKRP
jgi:predicted O-methyltransferase YrrM